MFSNGRIALNRVPVGMPFHSDGRIFVALRKKDTAVLVVNISGQLDKPVWMTYLRLDSGVRCVSITDIHRLTEYQRNRYIHVFWGALVCSLLNQLLMSMDPNHLMLLARGFRTKYRFRLARYAIL